MSIIISGQPASYYSFGNGILGLNGYSIQAQPPVPATTAYELTLENDGNGTVSASTLSGFPGESATLSTTPNTDYELSGYSVTGGTIDGNTFIYGNQDATAKAWFKQSIVYLTLQNDGHGTLTATSLTGRPGDTVTLTPTYNTYYRFNNYSVTGGTVNGNTYTFGTATNQTAKANFKVNAFTARGVFNNNNINFVDAAFYFSGAIWYAHYTGGTNVPAAYYNKTYTSQINAKSKTNARGSGWCPTGSISAYSMTANVTGCGIARGTGGRTMVGTVKANGAFVKSASLYVGADKTSNTGPVVTNAVTNKTGHLSYTYNNIGSYYNNSYKINGNFTATGYAP